MDSALQQLWHDDQLTPKTADRHTQAGDLPTRSGVSAHVVLAKGRAQGAEVATDAATDGAIEIASGPVPFILIRRGEKIADATKEAIRAGKLIRITERGARRTLRRNLADYFGLPNFPVVAEAHHIVPIELFDTELGRRLHNLGINLNGPDNGMFLPTRAFEQWKGAIHSGRTPNSYLDTVREALKEVSNRSEALLALDNLKQGLADGTIDLNRRR